MSPGPIWSLITRLLDEGPKKCNVMQSDRNSFWIDVVLDRFKGASRDKDNTLNQMYKSKYDRIFIKRGLTPRMRGSLYCFTES